MNNKEHLLIFDLDGTLWDSSAEVAESWNIVLRRNIEGWKDLTSADIQSVMGTTMAEIAQTYLPDLPVDKRIRLFDECQTFEIGYIKEHGGKLFPNVRETLTELVNAGYKMAIVSNCQTGYIDAFLTSMDMKEFFCDYEEWGTQRRIKAENISLVMDRNGFEKAIYIGDIDRDQLAAEDAGIPFICADYGFGKIENAQYAVSTFAELPAAIAKIEAAEA